MNRLPVIALLFVVGTAFAQSPNEHIVQPTISVPSGTYASAQEVTLTETDPNVAIYYTVDGSIPTTASPAWGGYSLNSNTKKLEPLTQSRVAFPFLVVQCSETLRAIAALPDGRTVSPVASAHYTLPPCSSDVVSVIGVSTVQSVANGLGYYIGSGSPVDWQFAKNGGATWGRFQPSWEFAEVQSPAPRNVSLGYQEWPVWTAALTNAKAVGMKMEAVAGYGPPFHVLMDLVLTSPAHIGDAQLKVELASGSPGGLRDFSYPKDYVCMPSIGNDGRPAAHCGPRFTGTGSVPGSLITSVETLDGTHAVLNLASRLKVDLPIGKATLTGCSNSSNNYREITCKGGGLSAYSFSKASVVMTIPHAGRGGMGYTTPLGDILSDSTALLRGTPASVFTDESISVVAYLGLMEELYPSPGTESSNDPGAIAFANYVHAIAQTMHAHGVAGDVEVWNEMPWNPYAWDYRPHFYDQIATDFDSSVRYGAGAYVKMGNGFFISLRDGNLGHDPAENGSWRHIPALPSYVMYVANNTLWPQAFGLGAATMNLKLPPEIRLRWDGTTGNGTTSLMGSLFERFTGETLPHPSPAFVSEAIHPYSSWNANPENGMWESDCIASHAASNTSPLQAPSTCFLPGQEGEANFPLLPWLEKKLQLQNPSYGLGQAITETNMWPLSVNQTVQQARGVMRQFIGYHADGVDPVEIFSLTEPSGNHTPEPTLAAIDVEAAPSGYPCPSGSGMCSYTPFPTYTTLQAFLNDLKPLSGSPVAAYAPSALPTVSRYSGTFALAVTHFIGSRRGARANSDVMSLWQISACQQYRPLNAQNCWFTQPQPPAVPVAVILPPGMKVTSAIDTITRKLVSFSSAGRTTTLSAVSDNPIEVIIDPF